MGTREKRSSRGTVDPNAVKEIGSGSRPRSRSALAVTSTARSMELCSERDPCQRTNGEVQAWSTGIATVESLMA
ncbi:hypothetical protein Acsp03_65950 [Actinomadura sp. NBRC 104412]|nr:hypothetical protein Acsp03_65950 [Actinomadura sp. NBRC 104412]